MDVNIKQIDASIVWSYGAWPASYYSENTGTGVNDNDVIFTSGDLTNYNEHMIHSTAGAVDVEVSVDGTNYTSSATAPILLEDLHVEHASSGYDLVALTAVGKVYRLKGKFKKIRLTQNGATAATAKMASYVA